MAGDDLALITDQDGIGEAEPPDAVGNLAYLFSGMGAGIAGIEAKCCYWQHFDGWRMHVHDDDPWEGNQTRMNMMATSLYQSSHPKGRYCNPAARKMPRIRPPFKRALKTP